MSHARYLAIVNPAAGGGRCRERFADALARLREGGIELEVAETRSAGDATRMAADAYSAGTRRFIAVGGDGTAYEIVNGLFPRAATDGASTTLAFLPLGTGNSFLRDFTEDGADYSLQAILDDRRRPCDVIRLAHTGGVLHYINLMSIGFVADVNGQRARRFKGWGEAGYVAAVVTEVAGLRPTVLPMRIDDGEFDREPLVFTSFNNSRFTGGKMMMAPTANTSDGLLDVIRVGPLGRASLLLTFPKIFKGTHVDNPAVTTMRASSVTFDIGHDIDVMVDGEALRVTPERLDVLPGALHIQA
jgi:YegS/Rv2252/BmrU family lipid kinase